MKKNQIYLSVFLGLFILLIAFLPEYKSDSEPESLFNFKINEIESISYSGDIAYGNFSLKAVYSLRPVKNKFSKEEFSYEIEILKLTAPDKIKHQIKPAHMEMKLFPGGHAVKSIFNDMRELKFTDRFQAEKARLGAYGLDTCEEYINLTEKK